MPEITRDGLDSIEEKIESIFTSEMEVHEFTEDTVPSIKDLPDINKGLLLTNCSILFVDIRSSTQLSDSSQAKSMAKLYRAFARAMVMCIYSCGGKVRQIAGDRVMGVFVDDEQEKAVEKALHAGRAIITTVEHVFNPLCKRNINNKTIQCGVGIDSGRVLTTSVGMEHEGEDTRDLVWAGKIANIASKHTDLAEPGEIFVTKRFYDKLPAASKTDADGKDTWNRVYRIKGKSIFEGYGIIDFFASCINEEQEGQQATVGVETLSKSIQAEERLDENDLSGINESEIITNVVEGVRKQTHDLLTKFETIIDREHQVSAREKAASQRENRVAQREREMEKRESELKEKQQSLDILIASSKNRAIYEVKVNFLRENMNNYPLQTCLSLIQELKDLGEKIGKSFTDVKNDLYYWKLVSYFKGTDVTIAFNLIIEQLTIKQIYVSLPFEDDVVGIVKQLGAEQEYLKAVNFHFLHCKPTLDNAIKLNNILKRLGLPSNNQKFLN